MGLAKLLETAKVRSWASMMFELTASVKKIKNFNMQRFSLFQKRIAKYTHLSATPQDLGHENHPPALPSSIV
jgi:hypothetical protein